MWQGCQITVSMFWGGGGLGRCPVMNGNAIFGVLFNLETLWKCQYVSLNQEQRVKASLRGDNVEVVVRLSVCPATEF